MRRVQSAIVLGLLLMVSGSGFAGPDATTKTATVTRKAPERKPPAKKPKSVAQEADPDAGVEPSESATTAAVAKKPPPPPPPAVRAPSPPPPAPLVFPFDWFQTVGPPATPEAAPNAEIISKVEGWGERLRAVLTAAFDAAWSFLRIFLIAFFLLRVISWMVRGAARRNFRIAMLIERFWFVLEGLAWLTILVLATRGTSSWVLVLMLPAVLIFLARNALREALSGLILRVERPFDVGDRVSIGGLEGEVVAFRWTTLQLRSDEGHEVRLPYSKVVASTNVKTGDKRSAYPVDIDLEVPASMDPMDGLRVARELAVSSPWSVIGTPPAVQLRGTTVGSKIEMRAFAFSQDVVSRLLADLLKGWREAVKGADGGLSR